MKTLIEQGVGKRYSQLSWLQHTSGVKSPMPQQQARSFHGGGAYKLWRIMPIIELSKTLRASLFSYIVLSFFFVFQKLLLNEALMECLLAQHFHEKFGKVGKPPHPPSVSLKWCDRDA